MSESRPIEETLKILQKSIRAVDPVKDATQIVAEVKSVAEQDKVYRMACTFAKNSI